MSDKEEFENDNNMSYSEADDFIDEMVVSDIEYSKSLSTIEDLNTLSILPESYLYEDCEEIEDYRKVVLRDNTINEILRDN